MRSERRMRRFASADGGGTTRARATALRLLRLAARDRRRLALILLLAIVVAACSALPSLLLGRAVDQFIAHADTTGLARTMLLLIGIYVVSYAVRVAQISIVGRLGQQTALDLRRQLFDVLQRQSLSFFDRHESGDLQSRLVNDQAKIGRAHV